jgi:UDP-2,4-diacetamido-2,4,6-trideoxy-beta-L-altropyranose hydrolase
VSAIVVRTDASTALGLGHAMRCLALAQALTDAGGRAVFAMEEAPPAFAARAARDGIAIEEAVAADDVAALAEAHGARWIVVDGYHLDGRYQHELRGRGARVLVLDDHAHLERYDADIVLNQNFGAAAGAYRAAAAGSRLLLGPAYALLRREFRDWDAPPREPPAVARRLLVTLGGSDPEDVSATVLAALAQLREPHEVQLLVGGANPHLDTLARAAEAGPHPVDVVVDATDVARRMAWADLAVAAAGGGGSEVARVGTPQVTIVLADNQRPAGRALGELGVAVDAGWYGDLSAVRLAAIVRDLVPDRERRGALARRGRELVDGRGAVRVLAAMGLAGSGAAAA